MTVCPNCQTENRTGAKFCKNCATPLSDSPAVTRPLDSVKATLPISTPLLQYAESNPATRRTVSLLRTDTKPLSPGSDFLRRPVGAIFGDAFLATSLVYSDEHQHHYLVKQIAVPDEQRIQACPNPACGAMFPYRGSTPEKYCTDCGTVLQASDQELVLYETDTPNPDNILQLTTKSLSHGSIRLPLVAFVEHTAGRLRYCRIQAPVNPLKGRPDMLEALRWGAGLARGLDYLHDNGVSFNGRLDETSVGDVGNRVAWADFKDCVHVPGGDVVDHQPDIRALAVLIFYWLTGKNKLEHDPNLNPGVSRVIEEAFSTPSYANGAELAAALEEAIQEVMLPQAVDYRLGRRTHVGMARTLNEDSLLTLEINRFQQSVSQPMGVYVVADGMGGHAAGEVASGVIVNSICRKAMQDLMPNQVSQVVGQDRQEWLRQAVETANRELFELRKSAGTDMGSTMISAVLEGNKAFIAHMGDSRAYLINSQGIQQLTTDHSLVERLIATHQITRQEARYHPQRNVIYRTMGDTTKIEVDLSEQTLSAGDFLLLCSDGLSSMVEDQLIWSIVVQSTSPQEACDKLVDAANAAGGDDNISVIVVGIVKP